MSDERRFIIVRHAHRDTVLGRARDNGLSKKGKRQALALRKYFRTRFGKEIEAVLVSSPKKRCLETFEPLADSLGTDVEVHSNLDEQQRGESDRAFERRIDSFLKDQMKSRAPVILVCAHGDWIPLAAKRLFGVELHLSKGGWIEFSRGKKSELCWMLQKLP